MIIDDATEFRLGDYREVLADVGEVDAVIVDPPYSARTEKGFRTNRDLNARGMGYAPINEEWAHAFVRRWHECTRGWIVVCGDHISIRWFEAAMQDAGRYVFPPLPIVKRGAAPRLSCDGPASQAEWLIVARPRRKEFLKWGSLPGWYIMQTVRHGHDYHGVSGAKSSELMRALVRDYTRPGDLVVDPCAGGATTLRACQLEGRRSIGAELDPDTHAKAVERLRAPYSRPLLLEEEKPVQEDWITTTQRKDQ